VTSLQPQEPDIPTGTISPAAQPYWDGCARGELRYQRCDGCGGVNLRPASRCARCGGRDLSWELSAGRGHLYSWTVVWRPQHPAFRVPYAPAVVYLDEAFYLVTAMVGCGPEALHVDQVVEVEFHRANADVVLPYFRPVDAVAGDRAP
jgi:uncharacterized protein